MSEHFWKLSFLKVAPRLRARAIWKPKSLKHRRFGALFEVELTKICTKPARENDLEVKIVKTPGARDVFLRFKVLFAWQAQGFRYVSKCAAGAGVREGCKNVGRRGGFEQAPRRCVSRGRGKDFVLCDVDIRGRVASFMSRKCYFAVIMSHGSYRTSYASAQLFRGRRSTFKASTWKSLKRIGILRSSVWSTCHFWRKSRKNVSFLLFKDSFLKELSQKSFVFELQSFVFEGSLAEKLRFWSSKFHVWRKSRRKASFLRFKASFLKEASQKSFVFELQNFIFEGSLAEMLRFWASKLHFWRKSRRKASFLHFKASILNEVSQKSFILIFKASFLKEVSHKSFVCLAQKLRLSRRKASFDKAIWITHQLTTKSLEPQTIWHPNHLNLKSIDNQLIWISNRLTTKSLESQINLQPNHLNLKSIDNHITWSSNQQTTKIIWSTHRSTTKSFDSQINWQPNQLNLKSIDNQTHLNLKSDDNQIIWLSTRLNLTSIDFRTNWTPHAPFL